MKRMANIFKILIALILVLTFLASCGPTGNDVNGGGDGGNTDTPAAQNAVVTNLTAKKLFEFDNYITDLYENSLKYSSGEKYGIRSYSGKDTEPKYDYISSSDGIITVSDRHSKFSESNEISDINVLGIFDDKEFREIVPCSYALFEKANDRYVKAYKAVAPVDAGEGSYIYKKDNYMTTLKYGNLPAYSYELSIIDLQTGQTVDKSKVESSDSSKKIFSDGSYVIRTTERDTVYNSDDKELFNYDPNDYQVNKYESGYYIADKYVNGERKTLIFDIDGTKMGGEFDGYVELKGEKVWTDNKLYNLDGTAVIDETFDSVEYEKLSKDMWVLKNSKKKTYTFVNGNGEILLTAEVKDKGFVDVYPSQGLAYEKSKDSAYKFYNFEKKDYSITAYSAYSITNLLVKLGDGDSRYDLIDATNGNMLCKGYSDYSYSKCYDGFCYIAAKRTEGGVDIYKVQNKIDAVKNSLADDALISENQLNKIYEVKEDMFTELEKALTDAGLKASIDRDNGEIAFDAAVVFAGDSSEISEEGKKLLDSFVKAYGSVLSNEKYKGFISKTIVEGHTAPLATSTYESGLPLSQERADKVKAYCAGVDSGLGGSFEAVGYSNSMPIYNIDGTINQDASRRVTFKCVINNEF